MKKNLIILFTVIISNVVLAQFSAGAYGLYAGSNVSGNAPAGMTFTTASALGGGFILDYKINDEVTISLQPAYSPKGTYISYDLPSYKDPRDSVKATFSYITIPLMAKFTASKVAYVTGGLELAFLQNATEEFVNVPGSVNVTDKITEIDLLVNFGVGFIFEVGENVNVFFEGRYSQGVVNGCKYPENSSESNIPPDFKNSSSQLLFGVIYDF